MKNWTTLAPEEKKIARSGRNQFDIKRMMDDCLSNVLSLLAGNERAIELAWALPWGNYLVNTANEIADYCKTEAAQIAKKKEEETT